MSVNLESASDIKVSGFGRAQNVTLRFYQSDANYKYYRLKLTATGIAPMYIYLGEYVTNPQYVYTHSFSFNDSTQVYAEYSGSLHASSFEGYFTQYYPNTRAPRFSVVLQSSTSSGFPSSSTTESTASRVLSIILAENTNFIPVWSVPTYVDTKYANSTGIQTLTGSDQKGVQSKSLFRFTLATATSKYGATNETYKISTNTGIYYAYPAANIEYNPNVFINLENYPKVSGDVVFTFSVEDSRGFTRSYKKTITIVPYNKIELTQNNTHRQGGTGQTVILDFAGQWHGSPLTLTCEGITAYEQGSTTPFATLTPTVTVTGNAFSYQDDWSGVSFDRSKAYTITAVFTDDVSTAELTLSIPVGTPVIAVRNQKVGINNANPQTELDVIGTIQQNGLPVLAYMGEIGTAESCKLNDYTSPGIYYYSGSSAAISNFPSGFTATQEAILEVISISSTRTVQKLYNLNSSGSSFSIRTRRNTWNSWTS